MNKAVQEIFEKIKLIDGVELTFTDGSVMVSWESLRTHCDAKNFDSVFNAVKVIAKNGAYFE